MPGNPNREFLLELSALLNKRVKIILESGRVYTGILRGIQDQSLNLVLGDAECDNVKIFRVFIAGKSISEITLAEEPFDLTGLAKELSVMFQPQNVKVIEEAGIIQVLDRFTVSEEGVKGTGPIAERISKILEKYKAEKSNV
ncbi:MAG: Lsm family RNA-binding protein [Candidatus Heimdallarchaeum endolithica]|uniref:Lsm family RNA-binding protein n=1 Tax=Candidatus Heimdallarchaeum endolithica TaxID=2876572 RepID=A0A9Y1BP95_9ARCH|nr:MAG: Lsm family RNA-binding protein [Candidatus Heimdallarchaeum endolithica]